jgi:hypothetical protein
MWPILEPREELFDDVEGSPGHHFPGQVMSRFDMAALLKNYFSECHISGIIG